MIYESYPWKRELMRDADIIVRWSAKKTSSDHREFILEKKIFLAAFAIRKLIHSYKTTDKIKPYNVPCEEYKNLNNTKIDFTNNHKVHQYFDLESGNKCHLTLYNITNLIIHSVIFFFLYDEDGSVSGFYVSSDRLSDKKLYLINIRDYVEAMRMVSNDYVTEMRLERDTETGEIVSIKKK